MKIALLGYGKMGKAVEKIALAKNHEIVYKVNFENTFNFMPVSLQNVDVAIDFSMPGAAVDNILKCFEVHVPIIVGTTGWYDQFDFIREKCINENQAMVYSSNFSVGVNIFFRINKLLANIMAKHGDYDVMIEEFHHTQKQDHPSGTALTLARQIMKDIKHKEKVNNRLVFEHNQPVQSSKPHELLIESYREGDITGIHNVK